MHAPRTNVLYSLQIGRAIAALAVVVQHAATAVQHSYPEMPLQLYKLLHLGYFGIDYFFVLSGFIIAYATQGLPRNAHGAWCFARSRLLRIYVPYMPVSLAMLGVFALIPTLSMGQRETIGILGSLTLLPDAAPPALAVAWTLQHEIVFYALFGVCLFVARRPWLIYLWAVPMLASLWLPMDRELSVLIGTINIEFLFGVAACQLYCMGRLYRLRHAMVALGALLIVLVAVRAVQDTPMHDALHRLLGVGSALLVLGLAYIERTHDFSRYRGLVFLGAASYALYLVHGPVISVLLRGAAYSPHWWMTLGVFVAVSCLTGIAYHRFYEKPVSGFLGKHF